MTHEEECKEILREREEHYQRLIDDKAAIKKLVAACEREFVGDVCQDEPDDEPVALGQNPDGSPNPSIITFGMIRRARAALVNVGIS